MICKLIGQSFPAYYKLGFENLADLDVPCFLVHWLFYVQRFERLNCPVAVSVF